MAGCRSSHASHAVTKVEWRGIYGLDGDESSQHGTAGSQCWILFDGLSQEVALSSIVVALTVEGSGKINALITPEDGTDVGGGGEF